MASLRLGERVKVRYVEQFPYKFEVTVIAICPPDKFTGRVEHITPIDIGDGASDTSAFIPGNEILRFNGQQMIFNISDIIICSS
jgi:hypothetical protein